MGLQEQRFTLSKLKSRLKVIESQIVRSRQPIGGIKFYEHKDASENPLTAVDFDDSNWQTISPPAYWGKWNTNYTFRTKFIVPQVWDKLGQVALEFKLGYVQKGLDFCHPESLVYIDGKPFAAADRYHNIVYLPNQFCDGKEHLLALHAYSGKWGHFDSAPGFKLFMEGCSVAIIDKSVKDFLAAVRVAVESADALSEESTARGRIIEAVDKSFRVLNTCKTPGDDFYATIPASHKILKD